MLQNFQPALDSLDTRRVGDAEVRVAGTKNVAGDYQELFLDGALDELRAGAQAIGDFRENIKRAAGGGDFVAGIAQARDDQIAPIAVLADVEAGEYREIGARGLRSIIENVMLDIMFDLPDQARGNRYVVTDDIVEGRTKLFSEESPQTKSA